MYWPDLLAGKEKVRIQYPSEEIQQKCTLLAKTKKEQTSKMSQQEMTASQKGGNSTRS